MRTEFAPITVYVLVWKIERARGFSRAFLGKPVTRASVTVPAYFNDPPVVP